MSVVMALDWITVEASRLMARPVRAVFPVDVPTVWCSGVRSVIADSSNHSGIAGLRSRGAALPPGYRVLPGSFPVVVIDTAAARKFRFDRAGVSKELRSLAGKITTNERGEGHDRPGAFQNHEGHEVDEKRCIAGEAGTEGIHHMVAPRSSAQSAEKVQEECGK
jgi:hypothetical protein